MKTAAEAFSVLLVQDATPESEALRRDLSQHPALRAQSIEHLPTALARLAGGSVDCLVLDLSRRVSQGRDGLEVFLRVFREARGIPVVLLCDPEDEALAITAIRAGASRYVLRNRGSHLASSVLSAIDLSRTVRAPEKEARSYRLAVLGAKGGVGATTVALNVAASLAQVSPVILAEMHPEFGTLQSYLKATIPGLQVRFGGGIGIANPEWDAERAEKLAADLAAQADYLVLDLPVSLSPANRALIEGSDRTLVVTERELVSIHAARTLLAEIRSWNRGVETGAVVVNRVALTVPVPIQDIEARLGAPVLGVIPPDADACVRAQAAGLPIITVQPDCLVSDSLKKLAATVSVQSGRIRCAPVFEQLTPDQAE